MMSVADYQEVVAAALRGDPAACAQLRSNMLRAGAPMAMSADAPPVMVVSSGSRFTASASSVSSATPRPRTVVTTPIPSPATRRPAPATPPRIPAPSASSPGFAASASVPDRRRLTELALMVDGLYARASRLGLVEKEMRSAEADGKGEKEKTFDDLLDALRKTIRETNDENERATARKMLQILGGAEAQAMAAKMGVATAANPIRRQGRGVVFGTLTADAARAHVAKLRRGGR